MGGWIFYFAQVYQEIHLLLFLLISQIVTFGETPWNQSDIGFPELFQPLAFKNYFASSDPHQLWLELLGICDDICICGLYLFCIAA